MPFVTMCPHCELPAIFELRGECSHLEVNTRAEDDPYGDAYSEPDAGSVWDAPGTTTWRLWQCSRCGTPMLYQDYSHPALDDEYSVPIRIYPTGGKILSGLPDNVQKAYRRAYDARNADPNASAVLFRRALEVACKEQRAPGKDLNHMLLALANANKIPQTLARMATHVRLLGNVAAHADDDDEVTKEDVPIIVQFVETILEYLYILPAKVADVEARFKATGSSSELDD